MSKFSKDDEVITSLDLASIGIDAGPVHDDFGVILTADYPIGSAPLKKGWIRPLVEKYGLVVIPKQQQFIEDPALFLASIKTILAEPTSSANEDIACLDGLPQVQVLGSKNSKFAPKATFIPARAVETPDSLSNWLQNSIPCSVTDWHSDEPWEPVSPVKFTMALSAKSTGPNATLYTSTSALYDRTSKEIKEKLEYSNTTFAPPSWLPAEEGREACHSTVQRGPHGKSLYMCIDATKGIDAFKGDDNKAKETIWHLTKDCTTKEHVYTHQWNEGDLLIWDNTRTLHARSPYAEAAVERVLFRMRVLGKQEEVFVDGHRTTRIVVGDKEEEHGTENGNQSPRTVAASYESSGSKAAESSRRRSSAAIQ